MSLTSAMFTGVSGLLGNAEGINVIGNNLANVNTIGFKSGRILFSDMLSANINNGSQIGRGSQIQKVDNLFTQSSFESTGNVTDLAIQGDSFFAVMDPSATAPVTQDNAMLTRAGAFRLDSNLNLVNADGYNVLDTQGKPIKFSDNATAINTINAALTTQCTTPATTINTQAGTIVGNATTFLTSILSAAGFQYNTQAGTIVTAANTFQTTAGGTASEIAAQLAIQSAAAAAQTAATAANTAPFTPAKTEAAQIAFDALNTLTNNSTFTTAAIVTAFDTFRTALTNMNTANATNAPRAEIASAIAIKTAALEAQTAATIAITTPTPATVTAAQTAFNNLSTLTNNSTFTPAAFATAYGIFSGLLNTANTAVNTAMNTAASSIASAQAQLAAAEGLAFSKITSIDPSGLITYLGKDGLTINYYNLSGEVGVNASAPNAVNAQRLAVVKVANPGGLEKAGGTLFKPTIASGISTEAFTLANNSANGSSEKIYTNSLEQSNVDMANEFVKMILTQRAYSANAKTITTSDEMTQEVINLKR